jgi:DNA-directed RNA polymerase specialized sigma24 family protein
MSSPDDGDHACSSSDRRHEDEQLLAALRATGLRGPAFDGFVARIIDYATGVSWKMVREEEIWTELAKIDRPRTRPTYWGERDKEQLVEDSVTDGYLDFHQNVLVGGRWDPTRASLNTLFVRYCLSRFADHYQAWQRQSLARLGRQAQRDPEFRGPQQAPSAERVALAKQAVTELSPEQFAHGAGYSHKEIGQMLGISDRAVEGRLYRDRGKNPANGHG